MVFKTKSHGHGEPDYTWIVTKYTPEQSLIEYTVLTMERLWFKPLNVVKILIAKRQMQKLLTHIQVNIIC